MKTFSYNGSAEQFIEIFDYVEVHREEATITRAEHEPTVVMPLSEYESLRETMYLMNSLANARRLMDSVARLEQRIHKAEAVSFIQKRFKCFWIKKPLSTWATTLCICPC